MSMLSLRLPDSLHRKIRELAREDNISINQFIASAAAEKLSALTAERYLQERAARAPSREAFLALLSKAPDVQPAPEDRLPENDEDPEGANE